MEYDLKLGNIYKPVGTRERCCDTSEGELQTGVCRDVAEGVGRVLLWAGVVVEWTGVVVVEWTGVVVVECTGVVVLKKVRVMYPFRRLHNTTVVLILHLDYNKCGKMILQVGRGINSDKISDTNCLSETH